MQEIWKDVPGFEGFYQVSNMGRVKSLARKSPIQVKRRIRLVKYRKGTVYTDREEVWNRKEKILKYVMQGSDTPYVRLYKSDGTRISVAVKVLVAQSFLDLPDGCTCNQIQNTNGNRLDCAASNLTIKSLVRKEL